MRTYCSQSFCDDVSHRGAGRQAQLQDARNRQANDDESADEHTDRGQSAFTGETGSAISLDRQDHGARFWRARQAWVSATRRFLTATLRAIGLLQVFIRRHKSGLDSGPMAETFPAAEFVDPGFPRGVGVGRRDLNDDRTDRMKSISGAVTVRAIAVRLAEASPPPFEPQVCDLGHGILP